MTEHLVTDAEAGVTWGGSGLVDLEDWIQRLLITRKALMAALEDLSQPFVYKGNGPIDQARMVTWVGITNAAFSRARSLLSQLHGEET